MSVIHKGSISQHIPKIVILSLSVFLGDQIHQLPNISGNKKVTQKSPPQKIIHFYYFWLKHLKPFLSCKNQRKYLSNCNHCYYLVHFFATNVQFLKKMIEAFSPSIFVFLLAFLQQQSPGRLNSIFFILILTLISSKNIYCLNAGICSAIRVIVTNRA